MNKDTEPKKDRDSDNNTSDDQAKVQKPLDYLKAVNDFLLQGNERSAYAVIQRAFVIYPDNIFVLSYYGFLQAIVDKKYRTGVDNCTKAIAMLKRKAGSGKEILYPFLYLNLGRAYMAAGKRKYAVDAFNRGLQYDPKDTAIHKVLQQIGTRKSPVINFLDRSNPINKYLGKIRTRKTAK